jgi:hypothetical protein
MALRSLSPARPPGRPRAGWPVVLAAFVLVAACGPKARRATLQPRAVDPAREAGGEADPPPVERWVWRRDESFSRGPIDGTPEACGEEVMAGIRGLGLRGLHPDQTGCEVLSFANGARRLRLVHLAYGEPMDCPSGCIQEQTSMILLDGAVFEVDLHRDHPPDVHWLVARALRQELEARGVAVRHPVTGGEYTFVDPSGSGLCTNPYLDAVVMKTRGDAFWWSVTLPETVCVPRVFGHEDPAGSYAIVLAGEIVVPIDGAGPPPIVTDGLRVEVRAREPDVDAP